MDSEYHVSIRESSSSGNHTTRESDIEDIEESDIKDYNGILGCLNFGVKCQMV